MLNEGKNLTESYPLGLSRSRAVLTCLPLLVTASVMACQVPVFRYALERWTPDRYEVMVLHDGPLDDTDSARFERLLAASRATEMPANFNAVALDLSDADAQSVELWKTREADADNLMIVRYPASVTDVPDRVVHVARFDDATVDSLLQSSVRKRIVEKLLAGESAVWIFVPCGDKSQDSAALKMLRTQLESNQTELELPPQDEIEADEFYRPETNVELRIGFSLVTLNRDDPGEQFLLDSLVKSEPDLASIDQPMAFPVLGRGRVLYALVGKGIYRETIGLASRFIVGPCSCQVKEQNPGFDLLLSVDWEKQIGGTKLSKPLPSSPRKPVMLQIPKGR